MNLYMLDPVSSCHVVSKCSCTSSIGHEQQCSMPLASRSQPAFVSDMASCAAALLSRLGGLRRQICCWSSTQCHAIHSCIGSSTPTSRVLSNITGNALVTSSCTGLPYLHVSLLSGNVHQHWLHNAACPGFDQVSPRPFHLPQIVPQS